jgi:hypothetical protein
MRRDLPTGASPPERAAPWVFPILDPGTPDHLLIRTEGAITTERKIVSCDFHPPELEGRRRPGNSYQFPATAGGSFP